MSKYIFNKISVKIVKIIYIVLSWHKLQFYMLFFFIDIKNLCIFDKIKENYKGSVFNG